MQTDISGVILAGGEGKRFGGEFKPEILIHGESIISRMTGILDKIFEEVIIVTNTPGKFTAYRNYKIVSDIFKKTGPPGGLHAGMKASSKDAVFVFAGDMPFLNENLIIRQIDAYRKNNCEAFIPQSGINIEPLHAIYKTSTIEKLEELLSEEKNYSLRDFISRINTGFFSLPDSMEASKIFTNINSPSDLDDLE